MAGQTPENVTYKALTSVDARLDRVVSSENLPRLSEVGVLLSPAKATLSFAYHDRRRWVSGHASARLKLSCQWCDRELDREIEVDFTAWLATDEEQALEWSEKLESDAPIVVAGEVLDVPLLIEDELLMAVPGRVCIDDLCVHRPLQDSQGEQPLPVSSPFAAMAELIKKG